jgi:hypothetical protein
MNTIERPEGFKEKVVELNVSKVYPMGNPPAPATAPASAPAMPPVVASRKVPTPAMARVGVAAPDYSDDIPF